MDIKEIAEQVSKRIYVEDGLLKEVGEPVGYLHQWIEYHPYGDTVAGEPCSAITNDGKPFDKSDTVTLLFTSDQVAAAIAKATKPLEEEVARLQEEDNLPVRYYQPNGKGPVYAVYGSSSIDFVEELRAQLAAAQEEIERLKDGAVCGDCDGSGWLENRVEGRYPCTCMTEAAPYQLLHDQLAKAEQLWQVAQGRCDGLEEKLAKAEQRVAEACALQVATETRFHWLDAARVAKEIRSGEWRKFVKEV